MSNQTEPSASPHKSFKRKFGLADLYRAFVFIPAAAAKLIDNNKSQLLSSQFIKRLQLAVTEVNGCAICSYQHTKMALKQGMSNEEISSFLNGDNTFIKPEEAKAIIFAQHFADATGTPYKNSTLFYELSMLLSGLLFLPIASIHGAMRVLMGLPNKKFDNSAAVE